MTNTKIEKHLYTISENFITELWRQKGKVIEKALGIYYIESGTEQIILSIEKEENHLLYKMQHTLSHQENKKEFCIKFKDFFTQINHYASASHCNGEELIALALKLTPQHYNKLFRKKRIRIYPERKLINKKPSLTYQEFMNKLLDGYNHNCYLHILTGEQKYETRAKRIKQLFSYVANKYQIHK